MEDMVACLLSRCKVIYFELHVDISHSGKIVIGAVAIRRLDFQPPPLEQFEIACLLFQKAAETSSRAARALVSLVALSCSLCSVVF